MNRAPHTSSPVPFISVSRRHEKEEEITWNERHELILKLWAEESICWQRLHEMSHRKYSIRNIQLTLPVIIMSTVTGTANFALSSFSDDWKHRLPVIIGSVNILSGMITTIAQYLRVQERSEGHRAAALSYGKLVRSVTSELSLTREERTTSGLPLVRLCRSEMDRLEEHSPDIDRDMMRTFDKKFGEDVESAGIARPSYLSIRPVEICSQNNDDLVRRRAPSPRSSRIRRNPLPSSPSGRRTTFIPRIRRHSSPENSSQGSSIEEEKDAADNQV